MKRQAGPREPESRGAWGPGEKPSVSEREARVGGWEFLPEASRRREGKGRQREAEEGLKFTEDPGSVEERPWDEGGSEIDRGVCFVDRGV
jgi:hypothetical protein